MTDGVTRGEGVSPAYGRAGVSIEEGEAAVARIRKLVRSTRTARVESEIGVFAGFFSFPEPGSGRLLVASMDGVGTKLKLAAATGRWEGVGYDIVSHCVNDILVHGARPIFFLDYIGAGRLSADVVERVVGGIATACREAGCALIGGETAEMPGMYPPGELDLVGTIIGEVDREALVDGSAVRPGHRILALESSGLHTNGYSLARRILDLDAQPGRLGDRVEGSNATLGDLLLACHRMYLPAVAPLLERRMVAGMAHITGGGLSGNLPRILPAGCRAVVRRGSWQIPAIFSILCEQGQVTAEESFHVFNMGLGYLILVAPDFEDAAMGLLREAGETPRAIGWIEDGDPSVRWAGPGDELGD